MKTDEPFTTSFNNYHTFITHQDGTRFYMMNYFFYLKIEKSDFEKKFHMGPLKKFLKFEMIAEDENYSNKPHSISDSIKKQIEICQALIDDDFMYIPFSASLISKFPFVDQMEKCLDNFVSLFFNSEFPSEELYKYIFYLINSIIIPPPEKIINFYLPHSKNIISIYNQRISDLPIVIDTMWKLLEHLSIDNIIFVFHLIILEQKILFVADEHRKLSEVIEAFINLIYPLQ